MVKRNPAEQLYLKYNAAINKSQCFVEGCSINLVGKHAANLERHIQKIHPEKYELLPVEKKSQTSSKVSKVRIKYNKIKITKCLYGFQN